MPKRGARRKGGVKAQAAAGVFTRVWRHATPPAWRLYARPEEAPDTPTSSARQEAQLTSISTAVLSRFGVTALLMLGWYCGLRAHSQETNLAAMALVAGATVAVVALARREVLPAGSLCRWDEAAAWLGIATVAHTFGI